MYATREHLDEAAGRLQSNYLSLARELREVLSRLVLLEDRVGELRRNQTDDVAALGASCGELRERVGRLERLLSPAE